MKRARWTVLSLLAVVLAAGSSGWADRGHMIIQTMRPDASVTNAGQKAIIGWNGKEEVLILSTDLSAGANSKVLEFLPLPSQPTEVVKAEAQSFSAIERIIAEHAPRAADQLLGRQGRSRGGAPGGGPPPVEIVFHQQIEAHDITIAKTQDLDAFLTWTRTFVKKHGGTVPAQGHDRLREVVRSYLARGYHYFVFDVIDLSQKETSVPPISYRFASDRLFFPLLISTLDTGTCNVQLFLFTPYWPKAEQLPPGFALGQYRDLTRGARAGQPIQFLVRPQDALRVSAAMGQVLAGQPTAVFTAARYRGPVQGLSRDLEISAREHGLQPAQVPAAWSNPLREPHPSFSAGRHIEQLVWSPMGARLAVGELRPGRREGMRIVVLDTVGDTVREVTPSGWISSSCWSPNGLGITYLSGSPRNVDVMELQSGLVRRLTDFSDSEVAPAAWQPPAFGGEWIAFGAFGNVWVVRQNGEDLRRVTQFPETAPPVKGAYRPTQTVPFAWATRGEGLRFARYDEAHQTWTWYRYVPATNRGQQVATGKQTPGLAGALISPTGQWGAYHQGSADAKATVWLISLSGEERQALSTVGSATLAWYDDRTVLVRGFLTSTTGLGVRLVDAESGAVREPEPRREPLRADASLLAPRPGTGEVAYVLHERLYLANRDGSDRREVAYGDTLALRPGRDWETRWRGDPVVAETATQWKTVETDSRRGNPAPYERLMFGIWFDLYASLPEPMRKHMEGGGTMGYDELSPEQQKRMLTGLVCRAYQDRAMGTDPAEVTPPEWYERLAVARVRFWHQPDGGLMFAMSWPDQTNTETLGLGRIEDHPALTAAPPPSPPRSQSSLPAAIGGAAGLLAVTALRYRRRRPHISSTW